MINNCYNCKFERELTTRAGGYSCKELFVKGGAARFYNKEQPCMAFQPKDDATSQQNDAVNHPKHYTSHPSGVECIDIAEHYDFCLGNALKYLWRAGIKSENPIEDLKKAKWYIERKLKKLEAESK